jgi:hypothetical protein
LSITFIDTERIGCAEFCTVQIQNAHQEMGFCYKKRMRTEKEKGKGEGEGWEGRIAETLSIDCTERKTQARMLAPTQDGTQKCFRNINL